jgi:hypothetical protein
MAIIGFNFTKILMERKAVPSGKININNNVSISNLEEASLPITNDNQTSLRFSFKFTTEFQPSIGNIEILGELFWMTGKEKAVEIMKAWKKDKTVSRDIMTVVLNAILNKCNVEALFLCRDMNLPSPIPLPKFRDNPPAAEDSLRSVDRKEDKVDKKDQKSKDKKK